MKIYTVFCPRFALIMLMLVKGDCSSKYEISELVEQHFRVRQHYLRVN